MSGLFFASADWYADRAKSFIGFCVILNATLLSARNATHDRSPAQPARRRLGDIRPGVGRFVVNLVFNPVDARIRIALVVSLARRQRRRDDSGCA